MNAQKRFLYVYGTLRAHTRHRIHDELMKRFRLLGRGYANAELFDLGVYPGIIFPPTGDGRRTTGEVYELNSDNMAESWAALDEYEGCGPDDPRPHLYERRLIPIQLEDGRKVEAWTYTLTYLPGWAVPIPGGDYLTWSRSNADEAALV